MPTLHRSMKFVKTVFLVPSRATYTQQASTGIHQDTHNLLLKVVCEVVPQLAGDAMRKSIMGDCNTGDMSSTQLTL